jgi:hypothetical protein
MTTYALRDGMTLVVTEAGGDRAVITFHSGDFAEIGAATAAEVVAVLERAGVPASVDDDGALEIGRPLPEGRAPVSVDEHASTAAEALRLPRGRAPRTAGAARAPAAPVPAPVPAAPVPAAPVPAAPVPAAPAPSAAAPPAPAGRRAPVPPAKRPTPRAGRAVPPAPAPAAPAGPSLLVHNMTASPIQLVMVTRSVVVPSGGVEALTAAEAAHRPLQRLAESGAVRLTFSATGKP